MQNKLKEIFVVRFLPLAIAISVALLIVALGEILLISQQKELDSKRRMESVAHLATLRSQFERELDALIYLSSGVGSYLVVRNENIHEKEINEILAVLHQSSHHIKNFGIAKGYRLTYVYPLKGNEKTIGLYYPDVPAQWSSIQKIVNSGKPALAGPINLVQGGQGLIYRSPLFVKGKYWGLLSTVIDADSLFNVAFGATADPNYQLAIRNMDGLKTQGNIILGDPNLFGNKEAVTQNISIPGGQWEIAVLATGAEVQNHLPSLIRLASIMLGTFIGWLLYKLALSRKKFSLLSARLNGLYELSPLGIALTDMQGRYIDFNSAFQKICGYTKDELMKLDYWELTPKEYEAQEAKQLELLRKTGYYGPYEKEYIHKNKGRVPLRLNGLLLKGIDGKEYIWSIVEDISESKKIDKLKNEFVSTVSHELRTPLTSISGALGLIVGGALGRVEPQIVSMLDVAYRNSTRLSLLINDLLDMEKLIAGKMTLDMQQHALLPILQSSIESVSTYARQDQVEFVLSGCTDQEFVFVDSSRLQQVVTNFLSNAAKFSPAESKVQIVVNRIGNKLRVNVIDNGPGISTEFRSRIFQKFSQADSSDTRQKGGTGLGLAISKEIIEHMNGTIGFESEAGKGTCFYFELPASEAE
jgi:PAS domain S-box-containing protein